MIYMDKRGQIYILAALIMVFVLYTLYKETNIVRETVTEDDFREISKNYELESSRFLNQLIQANSDVRNSFINFTVLFTSYAKTKNPNFGLIYAFLYQNHIYIGNYMDTNINFHFGSNNYNLNGCYNNINASISIAGLNLAITGIPYSIISPCVTPSTASVSSSNNILNFQIADGNITYNVQLAPSNPEIIFVSREKTGVERKVYSKGNFI